MENGKKKNECMSNIVIDGRMINESGIGRYLRNLIFELQILDKQNNYFILHLRPDYDSLVYRNKNFHKILADFKWYTVSEQIKLPVLLNKLNPDLVHFPHFNVPIFYRGKFVVTIHDLIHQHFQMRRVTTHDPLTHNLKQFGYNMVFKNALNMTEKIIVPSNYVKELLVRKWNVGETKIAVIYEGVDKNFSIGGKMSRGKSDEFLKKFHIQKPFIFYVGNAHPHKNIEGLIKAFIQLHLRGVSSTDSQLHLGGDRVQLVLAGQDNFFWKKIKSSAFSRQSSDIVYTGFVSDEELVVLYKNAQCFVMPSFEEGFGIPILEAMAMGCPVVSSNAGSLKEVGGDAAIYFDPHDQEDMGDKINRVLNSERLREELIKKGMMRVKKFSWKKMAEATLEVYNQCM